MEIRRYDPSLAQAWNAFNERARNGHFLFDRGFMDYHADRFLDASLLAFDEREIVALIPANRSGNQIHSHQGLTFGGAVVEDARSSMILEALSGFSAAWRDDGAVELHYKALPWIYARRPSQEDLYWLFRSGAVLSRRDLTTTIDYRAPGEPSRRRIRGGRSAAKAGVRFTRSHDWAPYWGFLEEVLASRHGAAPVHRVDEIERLAASFPQQIALYTALLEDRILAGVVMFVSREVAHAQYIAAGEEGRGLGALDGLLSHLISEYDDGRRYFDFGISNTDQGRVLNEGLIRQKEEFGGSAVAHETYMVELR